ncbi:Ccr4 associated factor [Malassezia pachydermatis]
MHPIPSETDFKVLVEVDNAIAPDFIKLVTRFKLRSKVKISDVSEKWDVYQVWGNGIATIVSADDLFATNSFLLRDPRTPEMGWRLLASKNAGLNIPEKVEQVAQSAYTVHRMLQGVPEGSKEIILNSSLPLESCMDYMHGVDFHKGCYIGQELTARTHFTGLVRKRILPVVLSTQPEGNNEFTVNNNASFSLPASGADVRLIAANVEEKPEKQRPTRMRSAGKFLNGVHNVGLALLRLDQVEKTLHPATSSSVLATESMDGSPLYIRARFPTWWPSTNGTSKGD